MKVIDFLTVGEPVESSSLQRLRQLKQKILILSIKIKDLQQLGVRIIDEFLRVVERRKGFGLESLEVVQGLVEAG